LKNKAKVNLNSMLKNEIKKKNKKKKKREKKNLLHCIYEQWKGGSCLVFSVCSGILTNESRICSSIQLQWFTKMNQNLTLRNKIKKKKEKRGPSSLFLWTVKGWFMFSFSGM